VALVKGFFAEEGLRVQGLRGDDRTAVEQRKPFSLWVKSDQGLTEADFGVFGMTQLHDLAAGQLDYYVVDGNNFGCYEVVVAPDSPLKSAADLKGKTIALPPEWGTPFRPPEGSPLINDELKAAGLNPAKDVKRVIIPWEALPKLNDYVAEGLKTGKFDAVLLTEPNPLMLQQQQLARPLFTQTYQAPYNQEYCCVLGIKRAIVDGQPDKAALIVRAFRRAKQWVAQNPMKAVIAAQAAGYYAAAAPVVPSANAAASFGFDREVDLAPMLERAFKERIDAGAIKTDKTPQELVRLHYRRIQ
jgi:NitT/TauT family transport system substrate-binding protein